MAKIISWEEMLVDPNYLLRVEDAGFNTLVKNWYTRQSIGGLSRYVYMAEIVREPQFGISDFGSAKSYKASKRLRELGLRLGTCLPDDPNRDGKRFYDGSQVSGLDFYYDKYAFAEGEAYALALRQKLDAEYAKIAPPEQPRLSAHLVWVPNAETQSDPLDKALRAYMKATGGELTGRVLPQNVTDLLIKTLKVNTPKQRNTRTVPKHER